MATFSPSMAVSPSGRVLEFTFFRTLDPSNYPKGSHIRHFPHSQKRAHEDNVHGHVNVSKFAMGLLLQLHGLGNQEERFEDDIVSMLNFAGDIARKSAKNGKNGRNGQSKKTRSQK